MMRGLRRFTFLSLFLIKLLFVLLGIQKWLMLTFQKINSYVMFLLVSEVHAQALKGKKFEIEWDCLRLPSREGRCWCAEIFEQGTCRTVPALGLAGVAKHSRGLLWPDHLTCFVHRGSASERLPVALFLVILVWLVQLPDPKYLNPLHISMIYFIILLLVQYHYIFSKHIPGSSEYLLAIQAFNLSYVAKAELKIYMPFLI